MAEYSLLIVLFSLFFGAAALVFVPNQQALLVRLVAAGFAFISLVASFYVFLAYDPQQGGFQFVQRFPWSEELGIAFYVGVDGIGAPLVFASAILLFAGIFISWHIHDRTKEFYIFLLILAAATIGVFMSLGPVLPLFLLRNVRASNVCAARHLGQSHQRVSLHDGPRRIETPRFRRLHFQFRLQ